MKNEVHRDCDGRIVISDRNPNYGFNAMTLNSRPIRPPKHDRDQIRYYK